MLDQTEEMSAVSSLDYAHSRPWVQRVISLLQAAVDQLHNQVHPAHDTLLQATSLLRRQIVGPAVSDAPGAARLLTWQARKVREYIDRHITEPLFVADLCALIRRSEAHFSRAFRNTFGYSPHAFVIRCRVELAEKYMLETDMPLKDVALGCGFADQAHFCRHFRLINGESPAAWRRARTMQCEEADLPDLQPQRSAMVGPSRQLLDPPGAGERAAAVFRDFTVRAE